ncbi:MAG: AraC family transcriptional regulator [Pseudomonadota bacterium]
MEESTFFKRSIAVSPLGGIRIACFVKQGAGVLTPKRTLPHFTLVYVVRGRGAYRDALGNRAEVEAGNAIVVLPGLEHWYGPPRGETWDELYLVFEGPAFDLWLEQGCFDRSRPVIHLAPTDYWLGRIKQAIGEAHGDDADEMMREAIRLQELLAEIQRATREDAEGRLMWLAEAKRNIEEYSDPKVAAAAMNVHYEVFRKKFKKLSGLSPGRYRTAMLMESACRMLSDRSKTLSHIAAELGFCDEYHFSKQFSKTIGWSPREYRARISLRN